MTPCEWCQATARHAVDVDSLLQSNEPDPGLDPFVDESHYLPYRAGQSRQLAHDQRVVVSQEPLHIIDAPFLPFSLAGVDFDFDEIPDCQFVAAGLTWAEVRTLNRSLALEPRRSGLWIDSEV